MVAIAFLIVFGITKEPCDGSTSRVQINPFHHKEPIMALYQVSESRVAFIQKKDGTGFYRSTVAFFRCSFCDGVSEKPTCKAKQRYSCGCMQVELVNAANRTHGMTRTPTYKSWRSMLERCENKNHRHFSNYGGRGIEVCEKWKSFDGFLSDMGVRPDGMTLDRIDSNLGYSKENCRWATKTQQSRNKRSSRFLTIGQQSKTVSEWAEHENAVCENTIHTRLAAGWSHEDAVFKPVRRKAAVSG